jgi:predicted flap endonuclease-1-like 5' DNA nuclease
MQSTSYAIADLTAIEPDAAATLKKAGIRTTARLLESAKDAKGRRKLAEKTGLPEKNILCWANLSDRMRIKGVGEDYANLLQAAGVDTVKELKYRNPERLAKAMAEANTKRKLVRVLPSDRAVVRWIENAKKLQLKISY